MKKDILVFSAHPDDHILGAGGTLTKYAEEGMNIHTVIFTYGEMSNPLTSRTSVKRRKIKELEKADNILGGKSIKFLNLKDGKLGEEVDEVKNRVRYILRRQKPAKIFTHSNQDAIPDNRAVRRIVLQVLDSMEFDAEVYTFSSVFHIKSTYPKLVVNISKYFNTKIEAMDCFESHKSKLEKLAAYFKAMYNGFRNDMRFAEVFLKER